MMYSLDPNDDEGVILKSVIEGMPVDDETILKDTVDQQFLLSTTAEYDYSFTFELIHMNYC
jgi:hypothetical protein